MVYRYDGMYSELAHELCAAIKDLAENPDSLENFEGYLARHFDVWMDRYASYPSGLTSEFKNFASIR